MCVGVYMCLCVCGGVGVWVCMCVSVRVCVCVSGWVWVCGCVWGCVWVCVCVCDFERAWLKHRRGQTKDRTWNAKLKYSAHAPVAWILPPLHLPSSKLMGVRVVVGSGRCSHHGPDHFKNKLCPSCLTLWSYRSTLYLGDRGPPATTCDDTQTISIDGSLRLLQLWIP